MSKIPYSMKIEESIINDLRTVAKSQYRSVNNTIEVALREYAELQLKDL
jgi:hypothetical protein